MSQAIEKAKAAIQKTIASDELLHHEKLTKVLSGFSGTKLLRMLQELANILDNRENEVYLEVGVFQGMTLLSTASASKVDCYGIDNFNFFDSEKKNRRIIEERTQTLSVTNAHLINQDYEDAIARLDQHIGSKKVGLYFVDGPHDYRSQLMCLELILPYLSNNAMLVVDDCNYQHVRQANRDFLATHPEFKLLFETYTPCHPMNMTQAQKEQAQKGWWDGVNVMIRDVKNELPQHFPPTERSRTLFENDHLIHSAKFGLGAVHALNCLNYVGQFQFKKAIVEWQRFQQEKKNGKTAFNHSNTYSENLPSENLID